MKINKPKTGLKEMSASEFNNLWSKVESYEMPFHEDYLQYKHKWDPDFGWEAIVEYRKFIFLTLVSATEITPSETIDEVWHLHILHTRQYQQFADLCGRFIHHGPGLPTEGKRWTRQYDITFSLYRDIFGDEPPTAFWPSTRVNVKATNERRPKISDALKLLEKFDLRGTKVQTLAP